MQYYAFLPNNNISITIAVGTLDLFSPIRVACGQFTSQVGK